MKTWQIAINEGIITENIVVTGEIARFVKNVFKPLLYCTEVKKKGGFKWEMDKTYAYFDEKKTTLSLSLRFFNYIHV